MTAMPGTLPDLLDQLAAALERNAAQSVDQGRDQAVALVRGRLLQTIGTLHLYEFFLPPEVRISADLAASLLLGEETEPTEGLVLFQEGERLVLQSLMQSAKWSRMPRWCRTPAGWLSRSVVDWLK